MVCPQCQKQENTGSHICTRCGYDLTSKLDPSSQDLGFRQDSESPQPGAEAEPEPQPEPQPQPEVSQHLSSPQGSEAPQFQPDVGFSPQPQSDPVPQGFGSQQDFFAVQQPQPGAGSATGSLICGIIGLASTTVLCCCIITMPAGLILGIISAIQGGRAKKLGYTGGKATAGMVLGSFAIVISVLMMVYIVVAIIANPDFIQEMIETYNEVYEDIEFNR